MPVFSTTGSKHSDFWLADGAQDFGWLRGGLVEGFNQPAPIRLHVGNAAFGQVHIDIRHGHWIQRQNTTTPELAWAKLQYPAQLYEAIPVGRLAFSFRFSPASVMIVEWKQGGSYFSIFTMYSHPNRPIDGRSLGRYKPLTNPKEFLDKVDEAKEKADQ